MTPLPATPLRDYCAGMTAPPQPSARKLIGVVLIILYIAVWAGLIALFAPAIGRWPVLVQGVFYLVAGLIWIAPLRPIVRWIESGQRRRD